MFCLVISCFVFVLLWKIKSQMRIIKNNKGIETLIFAETFEFEAYEQIKKLINFEAYENAKVRIMPDAHAGKGCTVGTTMTIADKITPNLVGVDIGCFAGDTKISLLNGENRTLKELTDSASSVWVYSLDENFKIVPAEALPMKTRINAEIMEVCVSGGDIIKCTPDHKFMLLDGTFKEAKELTVFDSLMPLYKTYQSKDGYEFVKSRFDSGLTHKIVASFCYGNVENMSIHHKDLKWYNNNPDNLEVLTHSEHSKLHRKLRTSFIEDGFQEKKNRTIKDRGYYCSNEGLIRKRKTAQRNIINYMKSEKFKEDVKNNGKRGAKYLSKLQYQQTCDICGKTCGNLGSLRRHQLTHINNHKVQWIRKTNIKEDVYCLNVPTYHNFALAAGVFVHNCGMLTIKLKNKEIDFEKLDEVIKTKVPCGFSVHEKSKKDFDFENLRCSKHVDLIRAIHSIGSLGGGNHFIEVGKHEATGEIYLIIHSGSRKLGGDVCKYYQDKAFQNANEMSKVIKNAIDKLKEEGREKEIATEIKKIKKPVTDKDLAFLTGSNFADYMNDMAIVQKFATLNRETMAEIILKEAGLQEHERFETIHNYIDFKRMILRKGAVSAENGETLLIPINMRDGSLLCVGKGNENWNYSAPHGAGRLMSRSKAKEAINMADFVETMKDVYTTSVVTETLDEAPQAYKSIDEIKTAITETVDIIGVIKPIYNFKAH